MEATVFIFFNATKTNQFKTNKSEIKDYILCLDNISKYFTNFNFFLLILVLIDSNNILDIHRYLMKRKECLG